MPARLPCRPLDRLGVVSVHRDWQERPAFSTGHGSSCTPTSPLSAHCPACSHWCTHMQVHACPAHAYACPEELLPQGQPGGGPCAPLLPPCSSAMYVRDARWVEAALRVAPAYLQVRVQGCPAARQLPPPCPDVSEGFVQDWLAAHRAPRPGGSGKGFAAREVLHQVADFVRGRLPGTQLLIGPRRPALRTLRAAAAAAAVASRVAAAAAATRLWMLGAAAAPMWEPQTALALAQAPAAASPRFSLTHRLACGSAQLQGQSRARPGRCRAADSHRSTR